MSIKELSFASSLQKKIGSLLSPIPLSANQWTVLSLFPAILGFLFAYQREPLLSLLFFILAGATDALDGAVARAKKQVSARGAFIDGMIDRLVEFLFVLSFLFYPLPALILPPLALLIAILFFGSCMTGFATAYAEHRHVADSKKIGKQPGILPRAERLILLFIALALVPFSPSAASFILACAAILSLITFLQRFLYFAK